MSDSGLTRVPKHVSDGIVRDKIIVIQAALATAIASLAAMDTTIGDFKDGDSGLTVGETSTLRTTSTAVVASLNAVATAITASSL